MKKRFLAALLCAVLLAALLPSAAFAAPATSVKIMKTEVTGGGYWTADVNNDVLVPASAAAYTVRYDAAGQKLYLKNLNLDFM